MKKSLGNIKYLVAIALITVFFAKMNIAIASPTTVFIDQPGKDIAYQYGYWYNYSANAHVNFTFTVSSNGIVGYINATGLKPYTTYQFKLGGKPTCAYTGGNDTLNEIIGLKGRWTCVNCSGDALTRNRNDANYYAHSTYRGDGTECDQGYIPMDYFTADSNGKVNNVRVSSNTSYHVLWCGGATCGTTSNTYLNHSDSNHSSVYFCPADKVNGEPEPGRGGCNGLILANGHYDVQIALTEESFHQGNWSAVLEKDITFDITTGPITPGAFTSATVTGSANVAQCQYDSNCTTTILNLCTKGGNNQCVQGSPTGTLTFDKINPHFKGTLTTTGLDASTEYALIYYADPWAGDHPGALITTFTGAQSNLGLAIDQDIGMSLPAAPDANIAPSPDYCLNHDGFDSYAHCSGAKIWVVPITDYDTTNKKLTNWEQSRFLLETDLATYTKGDPTPTLCVNSTCVLKTCGISATGDPDFGNIVPGTTTSGNDISTVYNGGNTPTTELDISGTSWTGAGTMPVGQTSWSVNGKTTWNTLTTGNVNTGKNVGPDLTVNFALTVPSGQAIGSYSQTITFTGSC